LNRRTTWTNYLISKSNARSRLCHQTTGFTGGFSFAVSGGRQVMMRALRLQAKFDIKICFLMGKAYRDSAVFWMG